MIGTIEQAYQDMKNGVTDYTDNGRCTGCGECCSSLLPVSDIELKRIHRYVKRNHIKVQKRNFLNNAVDLTCPFLRMDSTNEKCLIYPVRPDICASFKCDLARHEKWYTGNKDDKRLVNMREEFEISDG